MLIPHPRGTAPGLICPVGDKVIYAMPGVPYEMKEMMSSTVIPDLVRRGGSHGAIVSRTLRTWGTSESGLAEMVAPRIDALDAVGNPTIAFLAKGIEGIHVRITARGDSHEHAESLLAAEEAELRAILGDIVFGVDDQTMEFAVSALLMDHGLTLGVAESMTGGMIASRLTAVSGAGIGCVAVWFPTRVM